ncbi:MAG: TraB/GumN family protein [Burkholderiaceae bacterium]
MAQAREEAADRGFLWRIQRGGHTSFLYGTLHLGRAEWFSPGPAVRAALDHADVVALEVDMSAPEVQETMQAEVRRSAHQLSPELNEQLEQWWRVECLPVAQLHVGPPELKAIALTLLIGRRDGFDPAYSAEAMLTLAARERKLPLKSLESMALQLEMLTAANPNQAQETVATILQQLDSGLSRKLLKRLANAWADSDLDVLGSYAAWCDCVKTDQERADMKRLLDDRNPGLADAIERLHTGGERVFAAVGALHMAGPMALPRLLADRGFKVERLF